MLGRAVTFAKASGSEVKLLLDGAVVGCLDAAVGEKVASAIDRGQSFTAVVQQAFPSYDEKFKPTGAYIDIKVEYLLEKGQPAIETENCRRAVSGPERTHATGSFFTTIAGVTFEGRQRIVVRCSVGERLLLVRDPNNPHDNGAIKLMRLNGEQLGFVPAHVSRGGDSSGLAYRIDQGEEYRCRISDITGGGNENLGVNIEISEDEEFAAVKGQSNAASVAPSRGNRVPSSAVLCGWIAAAIVLLLLIAFITQKG